MVGFCGYREKNERESYLVIAKKRQIEEAGNGNISYRNWQDSNARIV